MDGRLVIDQPGNLGDRERGSRTEHLEGVWSSAAACMTSYLLLAERAAAFRADPRVQDAMTYSGVLDLAVPTLEYGETAADLLAAAADFDPDKAAERDLGFVHLQQLALEHLVGAHR